MKNKKELMIMKEKTIFPREEKSEVLFDKILNDPWAYNKLFQTFCNNLFCNDDSEAILSPLQFTEALFNCYSNKEDRKSTRLNSSHSRRSRMPSSA